MYKHGRRVLVLVSIGAWKSIECPIRERTATPLLRSPLAPSDLKTNERKSHHPRQSAISQHPCRVVGLLDTVHWCGAFIPQLSPFSSTNVVGKQARILRVLEERPSAKDVDHLSLGVDTHLVVVDERRSAVGLQ